MDRTQDNSNFALEQLRTLLRSEKLSTDGRLPTERALSDRLGVSRRAVRRALDVLEAEGMVWRRQGSGTYAGPRPQSWSQFEAIASGTIPPIDPAAGFLDTGATLITDKPVAGVESIDTTEGLELCWG